MRVRAACWSVAIIGSAALAALIVPWWLQPVFRTHDESVRHVLQQRGVAFRGLGFTQSYEEYQTLRVYSASITVELVDGRQVHGWIGCENRDRDCFLELRAVGIVGQRLPDITPRRALPWLGALRRRWEALGAALGLAP